MWTPLRVRNRISETLNTCWMYCTFRSLLRAPPLPASHEKKLLTKWFINSKEPIALVARGIVLSLTSILLDLIMKQFNLSSVWLLFEINCQRCLLFTCFLHPLCVVNILWLQVCTGQWKRQSQSSSSKWSLFVLGVAFGNFDSLTSFSRLFILFISFKSIYF